MVHARQSSTIVFLAALLSTSVAFGAALAHALELPNKLTLSLDDYFIVQQIYSGWNNLAFVLLIEIATLSAVAVLYRRTNAVWLPALAALGFVVAAQVIFWAYTFPANQATSNWTMVPETWDALRTDWEFSHLAGAVMQFLAMTAISIAALNRNNH